MDEIYDLAIRAGQFDNDISTFDNLRHGRITDQMRTRLECIQREHEGMIALVGGIDEIVKSCRSNDQLCAAITCIIAPSSVKQNRTEAILKDYLEHSVPELQQIQVLPKSGKGAVYLNFTDVKIKSIDLMATFGSRRVLMSHKKTDSQGGAQDNTKIEIQTLISCWKQQHRSEILTIILDGNYWRHNKHAALFQEGSRNLVVCHHEQLRGKLLALL